MQAHLRFCKHPCCGTGIGTTGIHRGQGSPGSGQLPLKKKKKNILNNMSIYNRPNEEIILFKNNKINNNTSP